MTNTINTIIEIRDHMPSISGAEIGRYIGVSREYVRQVLKGAGRPTNALANKKPCPQCGKPIPKGNHKYCCQECRHNVTLVPVICDSCGKLIWVSGKKKIRFEEKYGQKHHFCNNTCKGRYVGTHYRPKKEVEV